MIIMLLDYILVEKIKTINIYNLAINIISILDNIKEQIKIKDKNYNNNISNNINNYKNNYDEKNNNDVNKFNDNYCLSEKNSNSITHIKDDFPYSPLKGLKNIGYICYMNAILQCFCHIERFIDEFKYNPNIINIVRYSKNNLTSSFKLLIDNLWSNDYNTKIQKDFAPYEFKEKISCMNPIFKGNSNSIPKNLVNFIIMTLHEELNNANNKNIDDDNFDLDQRNQQLMFNKYVKEFMESNRSLISDLFYGTKCNIIRCNKCGNKYLIIKYIFSLYFH